MIKIWKKEIKLQFGAAIDMLENAIEKCPEEHWNNSTNFWHISYHTIFWLDFYLSKRPLAFSPPPPFTLSEFESGGVLPDRVYTKVEIIEYLIQCRQKCHQRIAELSIDDSKDRFIARGKDYSLLEILLYNMRHVQHHAAQLNLLLRQSIDESPGWVSQGNMS